MGYLLRLLARGLAGEFTGYLTKFLKAPPDVTLETARAEVAEHPRRPNLWLVLGLKEMELGRLGPARQALEEAVRLDPRLEDARVALAWSEAIRIAGSPRATALLAGSRRGASAFALLPLEDGQEAVHILLACAQVGLPCSFSVKPLHQYA